MTDKTINDLTAGVAITATDLTITRKASNTEDTKSLMSDIKAYVAPVANNLFVFGSGTAYSLTATPALVHLGSTDPTLTLTLAGLYRIDARVVINYNGATFAAVRTATMKLRRTNNTAGDLTNGSTASKTEVVTTISGTFLIVTWSVEYTTANTNDIISIYGSLDVVPTAGSLDCVEASIFAWRPQQ